MRVSSFQNGREQAPSLLVAGNPERIKQFPDAPTFTELGVKGLEDEAMWRGLAVKKGTPEEAIVWWESLLKKVAADPEWRGFLEKDGIDVVDYGRKEFTPQIQKDLDDSMVYLKKYGLIK